MRFSQRIGQNPVKSVFQIESVDNDLKNRLWNIIFDSIAKLKFYTFKDENERSTFYYKLWREFFNIPLNEIPKAAQTVNDTLAMKFIRDWYVSAKWYEVYDLLEFILSVESFRTKKALTEKINEVLRLEMSAYRIVDEVIMRINSNEEIEAIEEAVVGTDKMKSVNTHLKLALDMLADRATPDYRNSIKESISAVEAYCNIITGDPKASLGKALAVIEKKHGLHGSLKSAFASLYGYTSDAGGIRHAMLEDDMEVKFEDAKLMMVSCASFINYLSAKVNL
jgi:hypothetical protein